MMRKPIALKSANAPRKPRSKAGWANVGSKKIYFRSSWELKYALYLQFLVEKKLILGWFHEPKTFWFEGIKRGCVSYLPDFKVVNNDLTHYWVEVKGYMDPKSKTKIKRFAKYFPEEKLEIVDRKWFASNKNLISRT